jgi:hypothetical protein
MKKLFLLIAVTLLISTIAIAGKTFNGNDTGKVEVVKYTFKLYKPVTAVFKDGFLKLPGVIDYKIDSVGNCVLFAKPVNNMMYDIIQAINKSGYKFTDMSQVELSEAEYENIMKGSDPFKISLSPAGNTGTPNK